jgi:mRNA interferase MazF
MTYQLFVSPMAAIPLWVGEGDLPRRGPLADSGKPRPAVVIQSDWLKATDSVLAALLTSVLVDAPLYRLQTEPHPANGLKATSQVMVDKLVAMPREKCGPAIGRIDKTTRNALNAMLSVVIALAD